MHPTKSLLAISLVAAFLVALACATRTAAEAASPYPPISEQQRAIADMLSNGVKRKMRDVIYVVLKNGTTGTMLHCSSFSGHVEDFDLDGTVTLTEESESRFPVHNYELQTYTKETPFKWVVQNGIVSLRNESFALQFANGYIFHPSDAVVVKGLGKEDYVDTATTYIEPDGACTAPGLDEVSEHRSLPEAKLRQEAATNTEVAYDACRPLYADTDWKTKKKSVALTAATNGRKSTCFLSDAYKSVDAAKEGGINYCKSNGWPNCYTFATDYGPEQWVSTHAQQIGSGEREKSTNERMNMWNAHLSFSDGLDVSDDSPAHTAYIQCMSNYLSIDEHDFGYRKIGNYKAMVASLKSCHVSAGQDTLKAATSAALVECREANNGDCYMFAKGNKLEQWVIEQARLTRQMQRQQQQDQVNREQEAIQAQMRAEQDAADRANNTALLQGLAGLAGAAVQGYAATHGSNVGPVGGNPGPGVRSCPPGYFRGLNGYGAAATCMPYGQSPSGSAPRNDSDVTGTR